MFCVPRPSLTVRSIDLPEMGFDCASISQLIDALGGERQVSTITGVSAETLKLWIYNSAIPPGWHMRLFAEAEARGADLLAVSCWPNRQVAERPAGAGVSAAPIQAAHPAAGSVVITAGVSGPGCRR